MAMDTPSLETQKPLEEMSAAVVILNYNGEQLLREYLPSVVAHTPASVDIIVADNGSSDNSVRLLREEFSCVKIITLNKNYGFAEGYNRALERVESDYVILLNSDVEVSEGWCEPLIQELKSDESIGAIAPKILSATDHNQFEYAGAAGGYIDYLGFPFCRGRVLATTERDEGQYDDKRELFWVSGAAFCCRLSTFRQMGGFDADFFAHMEEIDICWRMQLAGYNIRVVPQSRVYHLGGGTLNAQSPTKLRLNYRNNLAMLYKCASPTQRAVVAVVRPITDMLAAIIYLCKGEWANAKAVISAYSEFFAWHKALSQKRKAIRAERIAESRHIYCGSIVMRYAIGGRTFGDLMR